MRLAVTHEGVYVGRCPRPFCGGTIQRCDPRFEGGVIAKCTLCWLRYRQKEELLPLVGAGIRTPKNKRHSPVKVNVWGR